MSKITSPPEKKRLAYTRDHYSDGGESDKAWRKAKPLKKAKARRAFRKASNDLLRVCAAAEPETTPESALRREGSIMQRKVVDWGIRSLQEFVTTRRVRNQADAGAKKGRKLRADVRETGMALNPTAPNSSGGQ